MIFVWLFKNIAFLQAFRNPYEKIGILLTIAYTPFFAIGLVVFSEYLSKIVRKILPLKTYVISAVILFMLFGIYALPMWTGKFAGGNVFNPWIKVPDYYKDANNWVNERVSTHRILHLPLNPGDGIRYIWPDIYQGSDINEFLFDAHSISRNVAFNKIYYNVLLERFDILQKNAYGPDPDISNSEFKGRTFAEEMAKLNVKYIILHKDIDTYFIHTWSSDDTKIFLENQAGIRRVSEFGNLEIYEVDLPSSLNIIYTEGVESSSIALTPVDYRVTVLEAKTPYYLNLLMPYSNSWQVKIGKDVLGRGSPLFSYANSWKIDRSGNYEIEVRYLPQQYIYKGLIVSLISIPLMIGLFIIIQRRVFQNG
ncbi:MAG: hypothetical protein US62_C0006G0030 [Candidatus Woesebacteria bacterium GW2011_GWA1_37_8]|uniref:Bacterial membrane protein YfhO n=1 Tax=Candidatus Woesebacteria bacterium GW2011_GWA1_37_8 TaxID=1618546 RepID=A0A0G0KA53_9BACT|nr:MAG: hypothetical protein US62_C0006G0030 [Candidatus Woesebacteria bacterium GW2011_GWA1_37_8]